MAQLTFNLSGIDGLAPRFYGDKPYTSSSPHLRYFGTEGQVAEGIYNPMTEIGYMNPANNTTKAVTGTTGFLLTSAVIPVPRLTAASTDAIFFADEATTGTRGKVMNLDTAIDTTLDTALEIAIVGGTEYKRIDDMVPYLLNGSSKIYYATQNTTTFNTFCHIGIANIDFGTAAETQFSGLPEATGRYVLVPADNGFLYAMKGRKVAKIDGTVSGGSAGTQTEVLFFENAIIQDGIDTRGRMWIALHTLEKVASVGDSTNLDDTAIKRNAGVYVWDRLSAVANIQDFIPIEGVKSIRSLHILQGQPCCFTESVDGYTQLRMWTGTKFQVVQTLGKDAYPNYRRHSVYEGGEYIMWFGADGKIYLYGKIETGLQNALYIIGDMTNHVTSNETFSSAGVFVPANDTETVTSGVNAEGLAFYISFSDTAGNHLKKWYPFGVQTIASNAQTGEQGDVYSLVKFLPLLSTVRNVQIRCAPTSTGSTVIATIKYYFNQSSTPGQTKSVTLTEASKGYIQHQLNEQYVNSIQIEIEWNTTATLGTDTFRPSAGVVEYDGTRTRGSLDDG